MLKIKSRIAAMSVVPLLGMVGFAGISVFADWNRMAGADRLQNEVQVALAVGEVTHQLQSERGMSVAFLTTPEAQDNDLRGQRTAVDETVAALAKLADDIEARGVPGDLATAIQAFRQKLSTLAELRGQVGSRAGEPAKLAGVYTAIIAAGIDLVGVVQRHGLGLDESVGRALQTYAALTRGKEYAGRERAAGVALMNAASLPVPGLINIARLGSAQETEFSGVGTVVLSKDEPAWRAFLASAENQSFLDLRQKLLAAANAAPPVDAKTWFNSATARMNAMRALQQQIVEHTQALTAGLASESRSSVQLGSLGALLATLVALVAAYLVGRSVTKPLGELTKEMEALAAGDKSIVVDTAKRGDEIGAMGRAVLVFKNAAIELERAEAEQARIEAGASDERRRNEQERAEHAADQQFVVERLANGLRNLADGDLTTRLDQPFSAHYEQLRADFNEAMAKLQTAMQAVVGGADGIHSGADEINRATDAHSRRTEQQAVSLEETAAALDQLTAAVRNMAVGAVNTNRLVGGTRTQAEASGQVVREAVAAMSEIEKSSSQISQIVDVIEEIAFQTNLLALNAGVEAARAGDAGRGFMVVATEVRALAQRSSQAAKEINELIASSARQVGRGVQLVGTTGEALQQIVDKVVEIDRLVSDMAGSAQEQAAGLAQINTAVNEIDQVTQQNAAMVEEASAASHTLTQSAGELTRLVARFQTGENASPRSRPALRQNRTGAVAA